MGQRSTLCTSQMFDSGSDPCDVFHQNHPFFTRNASNYPVISAPGNTMNFCHQFADYHEGLMFYGNDYINAQNLQAAGPNFYNPNMLLAPSGRVFPLHQSDNCFKMEEINWHNQVFDSSCSSCKRKNFASSSSSTSFGVPQWGQSYESLQHVVYATSFAIPEYGDNVMNQNCLPPESYMMQTFQPSNNGWVPQFGHVNNIGEGSSTLNQNNSVRYLQGACLDSRPLEMMTPVNMQAYTGTNSAIFFHQSSMPIVHPPLQNVHVRSYRPHANIPATLQHAVNLRFPYAEDATLMNLPEIYGDGNAIDQHQDMRLEIDGMSYEELLALEERIGVVKTGLTEEFITRNLKTSGPSIRSSSMEDEDCAVCQVAYEENDVVGALHCGHSYHADCIKQWLLMKNLCPICKTSALSSES